MPVTSTEEVWVAVAYGALDMRGNADVGDDVEIALLPISPIVEPIGLTGAPAALWRRLLEGPVPTALLLPEERELVDSFAEFGIVSNNPAHPARILTLDAPWLASPLHELVYALVASIARDNGIAAVFIKGQVLHRQGLRARVHSGDVDVWVDPDDVDRLSVAMRPWGWHDGGDLWAGFSFNHSLTLRYDRWGCEIDTHRHLPGCAVDDGTAFRALLRQSEAMTFAGIQARVPAMSAHAVLASLHALRPSWHSGNGSSASTEAVRMLTAGGAAGVRFAEELRAVPALEEALSEAFAGSDFSRDYLAPINWRWRAQPTRAGAYLLLLRSLEWRERIAFVIRLIWPPIAVLRLSEERAGITPGPALLSRWRRLRRGLHKETLV